MVTSSPEKVDVDVYVGESLKTFRESRGLSRSELGKRVNVTEDALGRFESGQDRIPDAKLFELGRLLQTTVASFFQRDKFGLNI